MDLLPLVFMSLLKRQSFGTEISQIAVWMYQLTFRRFSRVDGGFGLNKPFPWTNILLFTSAWVKTGQKVNKTLNLFATYVTNHMTRTRRIFDMPIIRWLICFHKSLRANPRESRRRDLSAHTPIQMALLHNQPLQNTLQTRDQISRFWQNSTDRNGGEFPPRAGQQVRAEVWDLVGVPPWRRVSFHRCKDVPAFRRPPGTGIYEFAQAWQPAGDQGGGRGGEGLEYQVQRHCYASNSQWKLFFLCLNGKSAKGIFFLDIFGFFSISCHPTYHLVF